MTELITGIFRVRSSAERAVNDILKLGYRLDEISIMMTEQTRARDFLGDTGIADRGEAGVESAVGGVLAGIASALTPIDQSPAAHTTESWATMLVAGPLAPSFTAREAVGLNGGVIGGLTTAGVPESAAYEYESSINAGGILLALAATENNADLVRTIMDADFAIGVQKQPVDQEVEAVHPDLLLTGS